MAAPSGPGSYILLSCIPEGARDPTQLALSLLRLCTSGRPGLTDATQADDYCCEVTEMGMEERLTAASRPGPRLVEGLTKASGACRM